MSMTDDLNPWAEQNREPDWNSEVRRRRNIEHDEKNGGCSCNSCENERAYLDIVYGFGGVGDDY